MGSIPTGGSDTPTRFWVGVFVCVDGAGLLGVPVGGCPPARSPHASLRLGVVDLEARPGPAAAHGHRGLAHQSLRHRASNPSRAPRPGPVDQAARLSETHVAFARACLRGFETDVTFAGAGRASTETGVAFAGEKRAFLVHFSVAVVMPVSAVPCWGRAVVVLVSMSPRCRAWCAIFFALLGLMVGVSATKFARRAQNGPNSAFLRSLGEFFAEMLLEGQCWVCFFAIQQP